MPDPTDYNRGYSFIGSVLPGAPLDIELDNIADKTTGIVEAIKDIRAADGSLQNGIVDLDALGPVLQQLLSGPLVLSDVDFPTRAEFVSFNHSAYADGTVKRAGPHFYQKVTGATTLADKLGWVPLQPYYLEQWGIVGTAAIGAVVDNAVKIAACFAFCGRATIYGEGLFYGMASEVANITEPVNLILPGYGDAVASASNPEVPSAAFVAMTAGQGMFHFKAATSGHRIYDVSMKGFALRGQNLAVSGIRGSSFADACFEGIFADRFRRNWLDIDCENAAISSHVTVRDCAYNSGSHADCRGSSGIKVDGTNAFGATQFTFENVRASVHSWRILSVVTNAGVARFTAENAEVPGGAHQIQVGDVISIYNSRLYKVRDAVVTAVPVAGVTFETGVAYAGNEVDARVCIGWGLDLGDIDNSCFIMARGTSTLLRGERTTPVAARATRKCTFVHGSGHFVIENQSLNAIVGVTNTEPTSVTKFGKAVLQYMALDRVNGGAYETEVFQKSQLVNLPLRAAEVSDLAAGNIGANSVPVQTFGVSGVPRATFTFMPERRWDAGTILSVILYYSSAAGAENSRWLVKADTEIALSGGGLGGWSVDTFALVPAAAAVGVNTVVIPINLAYARGDAVIIDLIRDHAHAADTQTGVVSVFALGIVYDTNGPNGAGANVYDTPDMRVDD